jgi:hypothetical protein
MQYSITLDVKLKDHVQLKTQIYLESDANVQIGVDGTAVYRNLVYNPSFEDQSGFEGELWVRQSGYTFNRAVIQDGTAKSGERHLRVNTNPAGGSFFQIVPMTAQVGESLTFRMWVRCYSSCPPGGFNGRLVLWGGTTESYATTFAAMSTQWQPVVASLDVRPNFGAPHANLRAQIFLDTPCGSPCRQLEIDAVGSSSAN